MRIYTPRVSSCEIASSILTRPTSAAQSKNLVVCVYNLVNNYESCTGDLKQAGYSASVLYKYYRRLTYCEFRSSRALSIFSINDLKQAGYSDQEIVIVVLEEKRRNPAFI